MATLPYTDPSSALLDGGLLTGHACSEVPDDIEAGTPLSAVCNFSDKHLQIFSIQMFDPDLAALGAEGSSKFSLYTDARLGQGIPDVTEDVIGKMLNVSTHTDTEAYVMAAYATRMFSYTAEYPLGRAEHGALGVRLSVPLVLPPDTVLAYTATRYIRKGTIVEMYVTGALSRD